jgi:uncharacterized protein YjdB
MKTVFVIASVLVLAGCAARSNSGGNSGGAALKSIQVKSATASVPAGLTVQLTATGTYNDGSSQDLTRSVTWTSSNPNRASVSGSGVVTSTAQGPVTITATSGSITGKTTISVIAALVVSITGISPSTATIAAFTQQQFRATAKLTDGSAADVTDLVAWTITPTGIATVSSSAPTQGLVTAKNPTSTTTVTVIASCSGSCQAQSGTPTASASLTVTNATPTAIAISPSSKTIGWGTQLQLKAIGTFSDNSMQDITNVSTWSSSSSVVFITSSSGLAIGKSVGGPATIKATFRSISSNGAAVSVDLSNLVAISVTPSAPTIATGTLTQFNAIGTFIDGSTRNLATTGKVNWSSSNTSVATIASGGSATGVSQGTSTITASVASPALSGSGSLNVENATLQSLAIAPATAFIAVGTQLSYTAVGTFISCPSCPFQQVLTGQSTTAWSSSAPTVASMGGVSAATGLAAGSTTITASSALPPGSIVSNAATLNVTAATPVAIAITPATTFIPPGATVQYLATATFSDGTKQNVTQQAAWSTADPTVATINSTLGFATGQGQGTTTISAKFVSGSVSVTGSTSLLVTSSALVSIAIAPANAKVAETTQAQFKATGTFADGSTQDLTTSVNWASSNQGIATMGAQSGVLKALSPGLTTITATFGSITGSTSVTITNATLTLITVSPSSASIALGSAQQFTATGTFSDGSTQVLINANWSSSDTGVAIVTSFGLATTSGTGTATIFANLNGVSGNATLTVQ